MKKRNAAIVALAGILAACTGNTPKGLDLNGTTPGIQQGTVYLQKFDNKIYRTIDSATITNGAFRFTTDTKLPEIYGLSLDTTQTPLLVFLDKGAIRVELDSARYYRNSTVTGSALHDLFVDYKKTPDVAIDSFIQAHPTSLVAAYALYRDYSYRLQPEEILANIALLDSSLYETPYVQVLQELVQTMKKLGVGQKAADFTLQAPDGTAVSLSDFLGKGYVLLDFWASWCGPCRRESPNLVKAYHEFHDKGFDILAVSLDKKRDAWLAAIEKDGLEWTHVSDLKYWESAPAALYGVRSIPSNVLIDKDGTIIARNLRGEELRNKLAELLK